MLNSNAIEENYYNWLATLLFTDREQLNDYDSLLRCLHSIEFTYSIPLDRNRYYDGIDLRKKYFDENNLTMEEFPCTVLEMMIALSVRCEESIMSDPDYGDRTQEWFLRMLDNLQIGEMVGEYFDEKYVIDRISIMLNRQYDADGYGGLFTIPNIDRDLRTVEIWYQMCWYLNTIEQ